MLYTGFGNDAEALATLRRARADQVQAAAAAGSGDDARRDLAETSNSIGRVLQEMGKFAEAEVELRSALAIRRELARARPVAAFQRDEALAHHNFAAVLERLGRYAEADADWRQALAINRKLIEANPPVSLFRRDRAMFTSGSPRCLRAWEGRRSRKPSTVGPLSYIAS